MSASSTCKYSVARAPKRRRARDIIMAAAALGHSFVRVVDVRILSYVHFLFVCTGMKEPAGTADAAATAVLPSSKAWLTAQHNDLLTNNPVYEQCVWRVSCGWIHPLARAQPSTAPSGCRQGARRCAPYNDRRGGRASPCRAAAHAKLDRCVCTTRDTSGAVFCGCCCVHPRHAVCALGFARLEAMQQRRQARHQEAMSAFRASLLATAQKIDVEVTGMCGRRA